jgi:hypothetical protein|tara:strand:- start:57 stop:230 length:174 start_codon:yes stop_codon:yes gene_type:complete
MSEELKEYLEFNPHLQKYVVGGVIQWDMLDIDIVEFREENPNITDEEYFMTITLEMD